MVVPYTVLVVRGSRRGGLLVLIEKLGRIRPIVKLGRILLDPTNPIGFAIISICLLAFLIGLGFWTL